MRWLDPYLRGVVLSSINRQAIQDIADEKAKQTSPSTANRYLALLRAILRRATYEWEWLDKAPKVRLFRVKSRRVRWINREEAQTKAFGSITKPPQRHMALFGLATGLRQRNVCRLEWSQVDLTRQVAWIHPDQAKRAIAVPLNEDALGVINALKGKHEIFVFTYGGKPVWQVNTKAWRKAVRLAGLKDFRWHDLRHTWASWHIQAGTPMNVLQELGGWECADMVRRYAHLDARHLASHAGNVSIFGTNLTHPESSRVANKA